MLQCSDRNTVPTVAESGPRIGDLNTAEAIHRSRQTKRRIGGVASSPLFEGREERYW
jgi:hypothetical protein